MGRADPKSTMSADTVSPLFPDRPIRPLPRRRIRERLTPEAAARIDYPVDLETTTPVIPYPPYSPRPNDTHVSSEPSHNQPGEAGLQSGQASGLGRGHDGLDGTTRRNGIPRPVSEALGRVARVPLNHEFARHMIAQAPRSASSSIDGEPFENTLETPNNKKKRKALPGSHGTHHIVHTVESRAAGVQSAEGLGESSSPSSSAYYHGVGGFTGGSHNVSGPGRGRYGRVRNGRSPLRTLSDPMGNWAGRNGNQRGSPWPSDSAQHPGIISAAIANAERFPAREGQENENLSLLHQQHRAKTSPASTEFTFTCDSQVPGGIHWPASRGHHSYSTLQPGLSRDQQPNNHTNASFATASSSRPLPGHAGQTATATGPSVNSTMAGQPSAAAPRQKPRISHAERIQRDIDRQATARQRLQQEKNAKNGFSEKWTAKDVDLCRFCEYEAYFGVPPRALIRQYELKERKEVLARLKRQRQIENAKKSRRNKNLKATKPAAKTGSPVDESEVGDTPQGEAQASSSMPAPDSGQEMEGQPHPDGEEGPEGSNSLNGRPAPDDRPSDDGRGGTQLPQPLPQSPPPPPANPP